VVAPSATPPCWRSASWPGGCGPRACPELLARHGPRWRAEYVDHPERLLRDVEDLLVAMGLVRRAPGGGLRLTAVANRYAPEVVADPPAFSFEPTEAPL